MAIDKKKGGIVQLGNPEGGNVEIIQAYFNPTRGISQGIFGYAIKDGAVKFFKLDETTRNGWEEIGSIGGDNTVFVWDAVNGSFSQKSGTWAVADSSSYLLGKRLNNTSTADGDKTGIGAFHVSSEGTYTLSILHAKGTAYGIMEVYIDSTLALTVDCYRNPASYNIISSADVTIAEGIHIVEIRVNGKNGSSSDYNLSIQAVTIGKEI